MASSSFFTSLSRKKNITRKKKSNINSRKKGKNLFRHHHKKTRRHLKLKLKNKGGDIAYYPLPGTATTPIMNPMPTENIICSDAKVCLAFGNVTDEIKAFYNGFVNFDYVVSPIKRIGQLSVNGFVFQIKYERDGYDSYAVLKSSQNPGSDNLMYEYAVGQYVNKLNKLYPCFLETYGLFQYKHDKYWNYFKDNKIINTSTALIKGLVLQKAIDYNVACEKSQYIAILIQNLSNPIPLHNLSTNKNFINNELMFALFQLYIPLAKLMNNFTHYDLHLDNILMYEPVRGKYIHYHYYLTTGSSPVIVSFKSSYMLKILDYGRCYFNDEINDGIKSIDTKEIYDTEICTKPKCNPLPNNCGKNAGFGWMENDAADPLSKFYISSQHKNISHDLLPLLRIYQNNSGKNANLLTKDLDDLITKLVYTEDFGTEEKLTMGYPDAINNVKDAAQFITEYVQRRSYQRFNELMNKSKDKLGDLYIYLDDFPMNFVPA